jgi:hypothetical protein
MPEHVHLLVNEPARGLISQVDSGPQIVRVDAKPGETLLAGALLRLQRLDTREVCREVAFHP